MNLKIHIILFIVVFLFSGFMHPVHVTVTNIEYNNDKKNFDVTLKIYVDDLENIVLKLKKVSLNIGELNEHKDSDEFITEYIRNNFRISINNDKFASKKLKFQRKEIREGALWLYFSYPLTQRIKNLKVDNSLLNDLYPDMTNLVIIKLFENENGYTLNKNTTSFQIKS